MSINCLQWFLHPPKAAKSGRTSQWHSLHLAQHSRLAQVRDVDEDVVCRVTVQRCTQPLLVKVVTDETNASSEDEQPVQGADLDVFICFFGCEGTRVAKEVDEADGNATVDVKNEL
jgi:hypothetical protein